MNDEHGTMNETLATTAFIVPCSAFIVRTATKRAIR
jgi:hypothetical protein